jgi:hypothetical protein
MSTFGTHAVTPGPPTILSDPRALQLRCARRGGCPEPACGKILLTLRGDFGLALPGVTVVRECPRRKSVLCEFRLDEALPSGVGR